MQIVECEQGSPEWFSARLGIPTASEFDAIMTPPKTKGGVAKVRQTYMDKLAGELVTGDAMDRVTTRHMERGKTMEDEARDLYIFMTDCDPQRVGFIRSGNKGASPDSLIGSDGGLEIKTALPHIQIQRLRADELPDEHKAQVYGCLWIAERDHWDFMSYCPKLPPLMKRVYRDEAYIKKIADAVEAFNAELQQTVDFIRRYGAKQEAA